MHGQKKRIKRNVKTTGRLMSYQSVININLVLTILSVVYANCVVMNIALN